MERRADMSGWMRLPLLAGVAIGLVASAHVCASEWPAVRTDEPLVIDGRLDEKSWTKAAVTADFVGPLQADGTVLPAKSGARVRVLWDAGTLYLGFECDGPPEPITPHERDGLLHEEEVVEVFLDFAGTGTDYLELQVSPTAVVADLFHHWPERPTFPATKIDENQRRMVKHDRGWNLPGVKAAATPLVVNGEVRGWTAEVALPVAGLTRQPQAGARVEAGKIFRANFVHYRHAPASAGGKPVLQQASWQPVLEGRPHVSPVAMGTLRCVTTLPAKAADHFVEGAPPVSPWVAAWRDASRLLVQDAHRDFAEAKTSSRESRFGEAAMRLNLQPRTDANIERAHALLEALCTENPDDDFGVMAAYYLGRIEEVHRRIPDRTRALACYDALARAKPGHLFAQMAAVKACVLRLYATENEVPVAERLRRAEARQTFFTLPEPQRDYHLVMADAISRLGGQPERELAHSLAAEKAGHMDRTTRANTALRIAEINRRLGRKDEAIAYYRRFLLEYSREVRVHLVRQRLAELEAMP